MSERRSMRTHLHAGPPGEPHGEDDAGPSGAGAPAETFREGLARWASTVTLVAVRAAGTDQVHATTATSFAPVSAEPPRVVLALGPGAQVLPFLDVGGSVGVSLLGEDDRRWASVFADAFPVAVPQWLEVAGAPCLPGAVTALACAVLSLEQLDGGATLVLCRVDEVALGDHDRPLLFWNRAYARLDGG